MAIELYISSPAERLGFEKIKRIAKNYNNQRSTCEIGGKVCNFRSKIEKKVAEYLELLKQAGHIKNWWYEQTTFHFPDDNWLIDFDVRENDDTFWYIECKGQFEARDRKKLKLLDKYRPEVKLLYVFWRKQHIEKMGLAARKYLHWRKPVTLKELTKGII